jgi:hypothetical protein
MHALHTKSYLNCLYVFLAADVWGWEMHVNDSFNQVYQVRSSGTCTLIDSVVFGRRMGTDFNFWWDITRGIKNPAVFTPPPNCKGVSSNRISFVKELAENLGSSNWQKVMKNMFKHV